MNKTLWSATSLALIGSFALAACQPAATPTPLATVAATQEAPTEAVATEAPTEAAATDVPTAEATEAGGDEMTITIWHQWDGKYLEAIQAALDEYTKMHPNVKIDISKPDDVSSALSVAIPAGEGPDIIGWANDQIGGQALAGNIVDLDSLGVTQEFLKETYSPAAVNGVVWKDKIWGLPETVEGIALVYNKDLVTDEYLSMIKDSNDFEGLLAAAQKFKEDTGNSLLCNQGFPGGDAYHIAPVLFGFGGEPAYVNDAGDVFVDTPERLEAAQWLQEVAKVSDAEESYDICKAALKEGKIGMWWTGPWAIAGVEEDGVNYGIMPFGVPFVGVKTMMITKNAVDRGTAETALDIIKYYTSAEVQKGLALTNKTIPAASAALEDPEVQALTAIQGFGAALDEGTPMANTPFAGAQWQPVGDAVKAIWTGSQDAQEALTAAQEAVAAKVEEMK